MRLASVLVLRFVLVALANSMMPEGAESADAHILAMWFLLFAIIDAASSSMLLVYGAGLVLPVALYASAAWCAILAVEQLCLRDTLLGYDNAVQMAILAALIVGIGTELVRCRRLKQRPSSLP